MTPPTVWHRLRALVARHRAEQDLRDELDFHLARDAHEHVRAGLSPDNARRTARARFGSPSAAVDACRDARRGAGLGTAWRDVAYAARSLRRAPMVAVTIAGTLAIGLGLTASVFTVFNRFVLRVDGIRNPEEVVGVVWPNALRPGRSGRFELTLRQYEALQRETAVFDTVSARLLDVEARIDGRMASVHLVTGNYFQMLGVGAVHGRTFTEADKPRVGAEPVLVLSQQGWRRIFDNDPNVVGRRVLVNGHPFTVVGVTPEGFRGLDMFGVDCWTPLTMFGELRRHVPADNPWSLEVIGRLKPGLSRAAAQSALAIWAEQTSDGRPAHAEPGAVRLEPRGTAMPLSVGVVAGYSPLFIAFGSILLIGCANAANLLLARGIARQREIAVRLSLGASRARIVRQLLTEGLLLALLAAVGALAISRLAIETTVGAILRTMPPELLELVGDVSTPMDVRVIVFVFAAAIASTVIFCLLPALQTSRMDLVSAARGQMGRDPRPHRTRSLLVVLQVTASALLLISAGIFLRAAERSTPDAPGLRVDDTVMMELDERSRPALVAALAADPAVVELAASWPGVPLVTRARTASGAAAGGAAQTSASYRLVSAGYFDVLGIPLVGGRAFTGAEAASRAPVAIVSEETARDLWPAGGAIGRTLTLTPDASEQFGREEPPLPSTTLLVVGVAGRVAGHPMGHPEARVYLPMPITTADAAIVLRVKGETNEARRAIVSRLTAIDPNLGAVFMMRSVMAIGTYPLQVVFWVVVVLGAIAMTLTTSGIFSVLSYLVMQRSKEIGVRMALGATATAVTRHVLWQALRLVALGLGVGVLFAWIVASAFMAAQPADVSGGMGARLLQVIDPFDPVAYAGSLALVLLVSSAAALAPALRAARVDPLATLRHD